MFTSLALLTAAAAIGVFGLRLGGVSRIARQLLELNRTAYGAPERLMLTEASRFPHVDQRRYETAGLELEGEGCVRLADFEPLTLNRLSPTQPTFVRVWASPDQSTSVSFCEVKRRRLSLVPPVLPSVEIIECVSEFSDRFLVTLAGLPEAPEPVPEIDVEVLPESADVLTVWSRHRQRLAQAALDDEQPAPVRTPLDHVEQQFRLSEARRRHCYGEQAVYEMIDRRWPHDPDNWLLKRAVRKALVSDPSVPAEDAQE